MKIIEKMVFQQLQSHLNINTFLNYIILNVNSHAILVLLDLSAAFDTIDYNIPISRLEHCVWWVGGWGGNKR